MCRNEAAHDRLCTCCNPDARRGRRHARQMRERGLPAEAAIDPEWATGTIRDRKADARHRPEAVYDPAPAVRAERARYGDLSEEEQDTLLADDSPTVRQTLARNPRITPQTRETLLADAHPRVRAAARGRWRVPSGRMTTARKALRRRALTLAESGADAVLDASEATGARVETTLAAVPDVLDEAFDLTPSDHSLTNFETHHII